MNNTSCFYEKITLRTIGLVLLPFVIFFAIVANIVLPILGTFFAIPFFVLTWVFIKAPRSKTCRLLLRGES